MFSFDNFYRHRIEALRGYLRDDPQPCAALAERLELLPTPAPHGDLTLSIGTEDCFASVYAYLHAPARREEYERTFAPRQTLETFAVPSRDALRDLCFKGEVLASLHLLSARGVRLTTFPVSGDNRVTRAQFWPGERGRQGRIVINDRQFFGEVPSAVWHFRVGGVQPCAQYLMDRVGEGLEPSDIAHVHQMVAAIFETLGVREEIGAVLADGAAPGTDTPDAS